MERGTCWSTLNGTPWSRSLAIAQILIPSQKGLFEMNPGVRRGLVRAYMSDWDGWGREAGCAVMMIAHPPKSAHETGVTYSGSTDWEAAARTAWFIGQADESEGWSQKTKAAKVAAGVKPGRAMYLEVTKSNYGPAPRRVWLDKDSEGLPYEVRPPTPSVDSG